MQRILDDFCDFKIKDATDDHNYMDKNMLVFNSYKTAKTYGKQTIPLPLPLKNILTRWIKINPTEWLFFDTHLKPLTSVKMNQRLNKIFGGKRVSVNALRHTYLTDKYAATMKEQKAMSNDMAAMGSSMAMANTYVKN